MVQINALLVAALAASVAIAVPLQKRISDGVQLNTLVASSSAGTFDASTASQGSSERSLMARAAFSLQNGQDAQVLNAQFAGLSATSSCTAGQEACVNGGFAQCVGAQFVVTQCGGGTQCFALPLVNSAGTSITCTTAADAQSRIAATGATGGVSG